MFKNKRLNICAFILSILAGFVLYRHNNYSATHFMRNSLPKSQISSHSRLLVIAPHPDDETLGTGGLIQKVLNTHGTVGVVLLTNGDGFSTAVRKNITQNNNEPSNPIDYIHLGYLRREESFTAMSSLGIRADRLFFLGYPDRGLEFLWKKNWTQKDPFRSPYTQIEACPYRGSFHPDVSYVGENLETDLRRIIQKFEPTVIAYPHSEDEHPDHAVAYSLVKLALIQARIKTPIELLYIVHHRGWPNPSGLLPELSLTPPHKIMNNGMRWQKLNLSPNVLQRKIVLIGDYKTQLNTTKDYYYTFARKNEIFGIEKPISIPRHPTKVLRVITKSLETIPILPGAITGIDVRFAENRLWFILKTVDKIPRGIEYSLDLTTLTDDHLSGRFITSLISGRYTLISYSVKSANSPQIAVKTSDQSLSIGLEESYLSKINGLMIQGSASPSNWRGAQRTLSRVIRFDRSPIWGWR